MTIFVSKNGYLCFIEFLNYTSKYSLKYVEERGRYYGKISKKYVFVVEEEYSPQLL